MSKSICRSGKIGGGVFVVFKSKDNTKVTGELKIGDIQFQYRDEDELKVNSFINNKISEFETRRRY